MSESEERKRRFVWVRDRSGNEYLCPIDALKDPKDATQEELEDCIDVESLKPYLES
jgi:hypothetical protein